MRTHGANMPGPMRLPAKSFAAPLLLSLLLFTASAPRLHAQTPKPASGATAPKPAANPSAPSKPETPSRALRPAPARPAPDTPDLGLPRVMPPLLRLPTPAVERLPNGAGLVFVRDGKLPVVEVAVNFNFGYGSDPAARQGAARALLSVLRFGGTAKRSELEVEEFLRSRQIALQFNVAADFTEGLLRCRSGQLSEALELLAEIITQPGFHRNAIEAAQLQLRQSIRTRDQNLEATAIQEIESSWFSPASPLSRTYEYASVRTLDRAFLAAHYAALVVPSRMTIGLRGAPDEAAARRLVQTAFGAWQPSTSPSSAAAPSTAPSSATPLPPSEKKLIVLNKPNSTLASVTIALPMRQRNWQRSPAESAAIGIWMAQLDNGPASELRQTLSPFLETDGSVRAFSGLRLEDVPMIRVQAPLRSREAIAGTLALWKYLQQAASGKVSPPALEAAKQLFLQRTVYQALTASARFRLVMQGATLGLEPGYLEAIQNAAAAMTPADYERLIRAQINLDGAIIALAGDERDFRSPPETAGLPLVRKTVEPPVEPPVKLSGDAASREQAVALLSEVRKAMGGEAVLAGIQDASWDYEALLTRASPPVVVTQHNVWKRPKAYRQEQVSTVGSGISFYDGEIGWRHDGRRLTTLVPSQAEQYRNEVIRLLFNLVRADEMEGYQVFYIGSDTLRITSPEKYQVELAIDFRTKLPERLRFVELRPTDGAVIPVEEQLSDYRAANGVLMPFKIVVIQSGAKFAEFTMKKMEFNTGITEEAIAKRP